MEKFSVKKPFTVLVAVIMVLMLGFVSITKMKTNLLPDVSTPYLMVVTVYPGASPERVETEVSDVLQNALTVPGVEKITATSAENFSLLLIQFVEQRTGAGVQQTGSGQKRPAGDRTDSFYRAVQHEHERLYDRGCQPRGQFGVRPF